MAWPELPFGISWLATMAAVGALAPLSFRAEFNATRTRTAARTDATVAMIMTPLRDPRPERRFDLPVSSISTVSSLSRHDCDAGVHGCWSAGRRSVRLRSAVDVADEVADHEDAGVTAVRCLVALAVARVAEAATRAAPAGDVERREAGHGHSARVAAERAETREHDLDHARTRVGRA